MSSRVRFSVDVVTIGNPEAVLALHGEVDLATAPLLREGVASVLGSVKRLVLDCSDLQFMDAAGVSTILRARATLADDGEVVLRGARGIVRRVFEIVEIDRVCTIEE